MTHIAGFDRSHIPFRISCHSSVVKVPPTVARGGFLLGERDLLLWRPTSVVSNVPARPGDRRSFEGTRGAGNEGEW